MAMILDAFGGRMLDKLAALVEEEVVTVLGVKEELRRLQRRMERISHVLQDAERKRIQSNAVAGWVKELKDVMYDADDIIDLCRFVGGRLLQDDQPSSSSSAPPPSVRCGFPSFFSCFSAVRSRHEIGGKIITLNERLSGIFRDMPILNLVQNEPQVVVTRVNPYQTSQLVDDVVGSDIKRATNNLVELMLRKEGEKKGPDVIAITGMAGIGKTTLAQNIFNHQKIQHEFSIKIWVCITQNFNEVKLLNEIIKGAKKDHVDLESKAQLLPLLRSAVSEKPFLLVLDDVWRSDLWDGLLRVPLQSGAISSRVLVTTRDQNVAKHMKAVHIHPVEQLPVESGWELLRRSVACTVEEEEEMRSLRDVGIQIVEKCHGLPLAIKTIAGLLTEKERSNAEWEKVLRSEVLTI